MRTLSRLYWNNLRIFDIGFSIFVSSILIVIYPNFTANVYLIPNEEIQTICRAWIGPVLTFLGLSVSTIVFMFTAVGLPEFETLRRSRSQSQLWVSLSFNTQALCCGAVTCLSVSLVPLQFLNSAIIRVGILSVLINIVICLIKLTWIISEMTLVKSAHIDRVNR
jgi:hypothetical protein